MLSSWQIVPWNDVSASVLKIPLHASWGMYHGGEIQEAEDPLHESRYAVTTMASACCPELFGSHRNAMWMTPVVSFILQMRSHSWQVAESYSNPASSFSGPKSGTVSVGYSLGGSMDICRCSDPHWWVQGRS